MANLFGEETRERGPSSGMGGHEAPTSATDEWLTPPYLLAALGGAESFDLDPCSPVVRPWNTARFHYNVHDNGLMKPWRGRVWLNPPYGPPPVVGPWMRRMAHHGEGCCLIFARTETDVFFDTVWDKATAVMFLRGRLRFHHVDGRRSGGGGAPSVLIAYGWADAAILERCGLDGRFIRLRALRT
jgi:hypothetical protein